MDTFVIEHTQSRSLAIRPSRHILQTTEHERFLLKS